MGRSRPWLAAFAIVVAIAIHARAAGDILQDGAWEGPISWPVIAIHTVLLPSGEVLQFSYLPHVREPQPVAEQHVVLAPPGLGAEAWVIDPRTLVGHDVGLARSLFCGGHSLLPDGRALITGGTLRHDPDAGLRDTHVFDPQLRSWTRLADMRRGRFYPTNVTLEDGRTVVLSGVDEGGSINRRVELFDAASGWSVLPGADHSLDLYPRAHLLSSGLVVVVGPGRTTETLDVASAAWQAVAETRYPERREGTSFLIPRQRDQVMVLGGFTSPHLATYTTERIDLAQPDPSWQWGPPMNRQRCFLNAIILLDGNVLVLGGQRDVSDQRTAVLPTELYEPDRNAFRMVASLHRARLYHSSAALLPDGRVIVGGGDGERTVELYSPPYMFRSRPRITQAPATIHYGERFLVSYQPTAGDDPIVEVALLRPGDNHALGEHGPAPRVAAGRPAPLAWLRRGSRADAGAAGSLPARRSSPPGACRPVATIVMLQ
ncbi:MAG: hypothetical protein U1E76_11465 [Planctomycetota bacterium]